MRILNYILCFFPSFIHIAVRRLLGQKIGRGAHLKIGTIINARIVSIGKNVSIGPFSYINAEEFSIDNNSVVKPLSAISTRIIKIEKFVHIAPLSIISSEFTINSKIEIGDHSRIFPFCWIDTGEGVFIGKNVGVGGHTLIFTHGVWSDYLNGGPISFGSVKIEDNVWLPWRVFILPNVTLEKDCIVGANSLVNKSFPKNSLIAGSPAKLIKGNINQDTSNKEKVNRAKEILESFSKYLNYKFNMKSKIDSNELFFENNRISIDNVENLKEGDILFLISNSMEKNSLLYYVNLGVSIVDYPQKTATLLKHNKIPSLFVSYLRRYGIRIYLE